jgi:hypothetical protein
VLRLQQMAVEFRVALASPARDDIERVVSTQRILEDVVRWGLAQKPPIFVDNVVVQDEYTHDVIVMHPSGVFLVYDTT